MTSPLAWLAGLGAGAESLGSDINQRDLIREAKKRQDAQDALALLKAVVPMGGQVLPGDIDPSQALSQLTTKNNAISGLIPGGTQSAIPNEATGMPDETLPNQYGSPSLARVGGSNVLFDPSKAPEALQERRGALAQAAALRKQKAADDAKMEREQAGLNAKTAAAKTQAQADYTTLQSLFPSHPLVKAPFDPDRAANYKDALTFAQQQSLQKSAYHPEARPKYGAFIDPKNPTAQPVFIPEEEASRLGLIPSPRAGGAGGLSGQTMQTMARMGTSYNDLKQAIDQMDLYENDQRNLKGLTPGKQALGAASEVHPSQEAHGLTGAVNNALGAFVGAKAQQQLGQDDPAYRTYLNNKLRVAAAFTELLPRPNQQLLQIEKGLSGADVGWNPELVHNVQARRRGGLQVLANILSQQGMLDESGNVTGTRQTGPLGGGKGGGGGVPAKPPTYEEWLKSKGGTP